MSVRVRYAPSPTGHLHIGNARTALFNYLFAKKHGGSFIVRVEDTDIGRNVEGGEESQLNYLKWLGIEWDESTDKDGGFGPYRQLERLDIYKKYADLLLEKGLAYKCYCTEEELEQEREELIKSGSDKYHYSRRCFHANEDEKKELEARGEYTIRFKVPENEVYTFTDMVKGEVSFSSEDIGDWVIVKKNGIPTYNFAVVIDDQLMEITHVMRGEEHITNTPKQMGIYHAFGWDAPTFGHMTLIVNENGKKLSKRDESYIQFIEQYAKLGYLPEALFNFISLLGWSPEGEEEILSHEQLINQFDENRLSKSPAKFDKDKLAFINNRYIKALSTEEMIELSMPHLVEARITDERNPEWIKKLVELFHDRMSYGKEIVELYDEFFAEDFVVSETGQDFLKQDGVKETLEYFKDQVTEIATFDESTIKQLIKQVGKDIKVKGKMLFMPVRIATTGKMHGPDLPKSIELLGKLTIIERLNQVIKTL
ncbi:glutamate--tRNA ligase [Haloplasma contractile]|uniref:Glutamate--tRNA ligase n=1 Tax=Haloplasma contractile SSD-17B TaxID=1033810 RepID=U2EBE4_9MOLU|nr:glutamate--tRNA ligase [Haloplasma contractile]ERJ12408.1 Glutamate--tRNA ligase protein [Haloplasma contractile SSD-17B]